MPARIARLPKDEAGRPVPFFVLWTDGRPDFRIMDSEKFALCWHESLCWVCGERLGVHRAFVIGPMCAVNRISSEPPSHVDCAVFSACACPFLSTPKMKRRERDMPEGGVQPLGGVMIKRNPGVALVWVTRTYTLESDGKGGALFFIGSPERTLWYCEGRPATRDEILDSINSGYPALQAEADSAEGLRELERSLEIALRLVPA